MDLEHEYAEYESILDHQNSVFCTNAYEDPFGIFSKHLAQFKTVLELTPVTAEDDLDLPQPFDHYLEVIWKEDTPIKSCLFIEEIPDDVTEQEPIAGPSQVSATPVGSCLSMPFTPQRTPLATSTPKQTRSKGSAKKNSSILDYFKPRNKNEQAGVVHTLKRKRTEEMEIEEDSERRLSQQENTDPAPSPAKKILIVQAEL